MTTCIGAGHSGITMATHLRALQVSTLVIDVNPCVGDSWRRRYASLELHSPPQTNSLRWMDYPPTFPVSFNGLLYNCCHYFIGFDMLTLDSHMKTFPTKDQMADLIECYAKMMEVNVWNETRYVSGTWNDKNRTWTVVVRRKINGIDVDG